MHLMIVGKGVLKMCKCQNNKHSYTCKYGVRMTKHQVKNRLHWTNTEFWKN